jgi:hypothetical protein
MLFRVMHNSGNRFEVILMDAIDLKSVLMKKTIAINIMMILAYYIILRIAF